MKWKRMMGMSDRYSCYKCGSSYALEEFDLENDVCLFCLFPETTKSKPTEITHSEGVAKNKTDTSKMLDNLDYTPEKQSKQAVEAYNQYKNKKLYKR